MKPQHLLEHLEKFIALSAVVKCGSIRKAAAFLTISQPSLSVKIKKLEQIVGMPLLKRGRDGIALTDSGHKALLFANDIISKTEELKINLEQKGELSGHVRIGIYDSIARYFWPGFYKYFSKKYPGIVVTLSTGRSTMIEDLLTSRELDIGLIVEPRKTKNLICSVLFKDSFSCFCTNNYAGKMGFVGNSLKTDGKKLGTQPSSLILFSQAKIGSGSNLESRLGDHVTGDFNIHRVENFETARTFCLAGIGLAVLPNRVAHEEFQNKKLIKLTLHPKIGKNFGVHTIVLACSKPSSNRSAVETLRSEIISFINLKPTQMQS